MNKTEPIKTYILHRLVKGEDLNHHGTLFAGRSAQWFVEAGFIAAANMTKPENIVCLNIHGMLFKKPVKPGSIIRFESKVIDAGRTRLVSYVRVFLSSTDEFLLDGFLTFVHVDHDEKPLPHGITVVATDPEDVVLQQRARLLK